MGYVAITILILVAFIALCSIKQIDEYQRGILFRFGKFVKI